MKNIQFKTNRTCATFISFNLTEDLRIQELKFTGGCSGNLSAISKLLEDFDAKKALSILSGNICGSKNTSCCDQLSIAIKEALYEL